ncbi:hypothetical protein B0H11DRAFT_2434358 [Mycena galericulata]|nr:hypothetical protein B0H11DRAFT_2434358 [Mycena galericulata]
MEHCWRCGGRRRENKDRDDWDGTCVRSQISVHRKLSSSTQVMSTHLFIEGGRHSSSALFSPLVTAAQSLAGQVFGAGIVGPIILPARLALSKMFEPVGAPSPGPPPFLYTVTLLAMQFVVFSLSMSLTALPVSHAAWPYANYAFQGFPLLFIPLALLPRGKPSTPTNTGTSPPTIAITVFTVLKYLYAPLWWITVAQGLNAYYRKNEVFSLPCYFMALDFAGFVFTFVAMYAVDAVAGETKDTMSVAGLIVRMLLRGPASTMALYYEAKEKRAVERTGSKAKTL